MANLSMTLGDYKQFQLTVTKNFLPVDLSGIQSLTFTLQRAGQVVFAQWGIGTGVTITSPATLGQAVLTITPEMQSTFTDAYYTLIYTWSLIDSLGNPTLTLDTGPFTFNAAPP